MKKVLLSMILILTLLFAHNVYAEDIEITEYTAGDYKFIIEKFAIRLYTFGYDEDGEMTDESFTNYQSGNYTKEIEIPMNRVIMDPQTSTKTIDDLQIKVVDLNTNIASTMVKSLVAEEIEDVSDTKNYLGEVVVYYKVTGIPEEYQKLYTNNYYKSFIKTIMDAFSEEETGFVEAMKETSLNTSNAQVINLFGASKEEFLFYTTAEDTEPPLTLYNYVQLSKDGNDLDTPKSQLMFTNVTDTEYLLDIIDEFLSEDYEENPDDIVIPGGITTVVQVPDTAMTKSQINILVGIIMFIIGSGVVAKVFINKE